jgi:hypothetical protein
LGPGPDSTPPESFAPQTFQSPVHPSMDSDPLDLALELASPPAARSSNALSQSSSSGQRPPAAMFDTAVSPRGPESRPAPSSGSGSGSLARPPVSSAGPRPQLAPSLAAKAEANAQEGSLVDRIKLPLALAGVGAAVIAGDAIAGSVLGAPVLLGAVRLSWIGAGLAVVGVLWIVYGLIFPPDD